MMLEEFKKGITTFIGRLSNKKKLDVQHEESDSLHDDLIRQRDDLIVNRDELILERNDLMNERNDLICQRNELILAQNGSEASRLDDKVPGILFNTLPKSASVFILDTLVNALSKPSITISSGYFPTDLIDVRRVTQLIKVKAVAQSHLDASDFNKRMFGKIEKIILQLRDPRQATLSWIHHLDRMLKENQTELLDTITPNLPDTYFTMGLTAKIDYQLKYYYPQVVNWIDVWLKYINDKKDAGHIMVSTYELFVTDPEEYFGEIFKFLGLENAASLEIPEINPTTEKNYRLGKKDEWKDVFTEKQLDIASTAIPEGMKKEFGWM